MDYPTLEQVNAADREQICRWYRFLPSPGSAAIPKSNRAPRTAYDAFNVALEREAAIMNRIADKLKEFGGFTPDISKRIGWGTP